MLAREIGGFSWDKIGQVWYITLRDRLRENSNFDDAASLSFEVAGNLFGVNSHEQNAVYKAWDQVGVTVKTKR